MYTLALYSGECTEFDCVVFDSESLEIVDYITELPFDEYEQIIQKTYGIGEVDFIFVVLNENQEEYDNYNDWLATVYATLLDFTNAIVRFVPTYYFYSTLMLLNRDKNVKFNNGDYILYSFEVSSSEDSSTTLLVKVIKQKTGWIINVTKEFFDHSITDYGKPIRGIRLKNYIESLIGDIKNCKIMTYSCGCCDKIVYYNLNSDAIIRPYKKEFDVIDTILYLIKIYTDKIDDYSSYIPIKNFWTINFTGNNKILININEDKDVIPITYVSDFTLPDKVTKEDKLSLTISTTQFKQEKIIKEFNFEYDKNIEKLGITQKRIFCRIDDIGMIEVEIVDKIHDRRIKKSSKYSECLPTISFNEDTVNLSYYKNGIDKYIRDDNGLKDIPTRISFNNEVPLFGLNAVEDTKSVPYNILNLLIDDWIDEEIKKDNQMVHKDENDNVYIIVNTPDGYQKIKNSDIFILFLTSMIKLMESKMECEITDVNITDTFVDKDERRNIAFEQKLTVLKNVAFLLLREKCQGNITSKMIHKIESKNSILYFP